MLRIKSGPTGCRIAGVQPQMHTAAFIASQVYEQFGQECVWTCGTDSKHMPGSLHYVGLAIDIAMPSESTKASIIAKLKVQLGDDYDVVEEASAVGGPHIHVEFQPKTAINKT